MDNDFCYRLIANPRKLKKSNEYIDYDVKLHELLKKKYSDYNISDEKVARLHLEKIGVKLTKLETDQAEYIGVNENGPFKNENYRY